MMLALERSHALTRKKPIYMDELDVLIRHDIPYARKAPPGGVPAVSYLLFARGMRSALYVGPQGQCGDFRVVAHALDCPHLSLASRFAVKDLFGRPPQRLTPMALGFYEFASFPVIASYTLMRAPAIGFPVGKGERLWIAPHALCDLVPALDFSFQILDIANEIPETA
jgi:hypothetical protein